MTRSGRSAGPILRLWSRRLWTVARAPACLFYVGVALLLAAVFVPLGLTRLVDADEGIYLVNARQVLDGQLPFHDFHWPQMFVTPYLYAAWMAVFGVGWYSARVFSALLSIALGLALYHHVAVTTGRRRWALVATIVFASSSLAFAWLPLVKTYPFGTLTLFLGWSVLAWAPDRWRYFLSGVFLGLAIDTRLYVVAVVPVLAAAALAERAPRNELRRFGLGLTLAVLPNVPFIAIDPEMFVFNIVGHHAVRTSSGLIGALPQKLEALLNMLGINGAFGATSFQLTVLVLLNLVWLGVALARRGKVPLSLQIAGVMLVVSLLPTPVYGQYFTMFLPFLVVGGVELVAAIAADLSASGAHATVGRPLGAGLAVLIGLYVAVAPIDVWWFTRGGDIVPGVYTRANVPNWTISTINAVGRAVDEAMPPGGTIAMSWWPGYFVETRAQITPLMANPNTLWFATRMTPDQIARYKFMSHDELVRQIRAREVPVVVLGNWAPPEGRELYRNVIRGSGFLLVRKIGDAEIYRWEPSPAAAR